MSSIQNIKVIVRPQADVRVVLAQTQISARISPDPFILFAETSISASYAINAVSASYVDTNLVAVSTASYAGYATYAENAFPYTGSAFITGSLHITGSAYITDTLEIGSVIVSGSFETPLNIATDTTGSILFVSASARVGINNTNPLYALDVDGDIYATGDIIALSDARLKTEISPILGALDIVKHMRGISYVRKGDDAAIPKQHIGFLAQELEKVLPEVVSGNETNGYGVSYGNISAILVEAIKELDYKLNRLEYRFISK